MQVNGTWSVFIENALDDRFQNIVENAVLKVPTPYGQQLFRITQMDKSDTGVSATAVPIFLDAQNDTFIYDQRPADKTGQQALDILMNGTKYSGHSDITKLSTAYYQMKNLIECLASDDENSFLNRWGGEIRFDDYDIYINERLGADNGARVEFGFNLSSIQESIDMSTVVTKIVPVAYNGYTLPDGETVNSPNIDKYPVHYIRTIHYDDIKLAEDATEGEEDVTVCDTLDELYQALRTRAAAEYNSGIDIPSITYQVDMVDLAKTEEYAAFKDLVTVNLGDTVHIKHRRLDIETQARIVALEYDCIQQKVTSLTIGDSVQNYFDKTSDITNAAGQVIDTSTNTLMANRIAGVINLLNASLRAQKNVAQRQDVRAILFEDTDESSPTYGALCIGTQGIQISKERNETDTDWEWGTAIDFQSIVADYIITGILTDKTGNFYLNLDTGELMMKDGTFQGTISTLKDLNVGNNIYLNVNDGTAVKTIKFSDQASITFSRVGGTNEVSTRVYDPNGGQGYTTVSAMYSNIGKTRQGLEVFIRGNDGSSETYSMTADGAYFGGNLSVSGEKSRLVDIGEKKVKMNAVESAEAYFEDFGTSETDGEGNVYVSLDELFSKTVSTGCGYYVQLQKMRDGNIYVASVDDEGFYVRGTPYTPFSYRVTAKQRGYEKTRLEVVE
jgi:phage minor structural protein